MRLRPVLLSLSPMVAVAAEAPVSAGSSASQLASVAGALALVVGLILLLAWGVKRVSGLPGQRNSLIRLRGVLPVGTRERIAMIESGGTYLLVGITAHSIRTLHVFDEPPPDETIPADSEFAARLKEWLQRSGSTQRPAGRSESSE